MSSAPHRVARLLRDAGGDDCEVPAPRVRAVERLIGRAVAARTARGLLVAGIDGPGDGAVPVVRRLLDRVRRRLSRLLERAPALARPALAARLAGSLRALERPLGIARERQLEALLRSDLDDAAFARRLGALLRGGPAAERPSRPGRPGRLDALLILRRASGLRATPAPRGASPGTAATR